MPGLSTVLCAKKCNKVVFSCLGNTSDNDKFLFSRRVQPIIYQELMSGTSQTKKDFSIEEKTHRYILVNEVLSPFAFSVDKGYKSKH